MFNIDFNKLIRWLTPDFMRKPVFSAYVTVLCSGVVQLYNEFTAKRTADLYELAHDSRVFSMRALLNDRFDNVNRTIYITDGPNIGRTYIYTPAESRPLYDDTPTYIYTTPEYADSGIDFLVWVPNALVLTVQDFTEMNILLNQYKLAGKRFKINRI